MKQKIKKLFISPIHRKEGFTLIELAMVLVVIGIVITIGVGLIGPLTKRMRVNESKDIVNAALESVNSWASGNKRLPTPPPGEFSTVVKTPTDAFTKDLLYIVDANLTTIPSGVTDAICGRKTTSYTVCRDASCPIATNIPNVAFAVVSGAENYNIQTGTIAGGTGNCPLGQTCIRVYEVGTQNIDDYASDISRQEDYDDIVKWVTLDELRTKVGCQGAQLKIANNELSPAFRCSNYAATIYAEGGIPFTSGGNYQWCVTAAVPSGLKFNCNGTLNTSATCSLAAGTWNQCNNLSIEDDTGISGFGPNVTGSYNLSIYARDNNTNLTQKSFVLTVGLGENRFRVWNTTGATRDFIVDGACRNSVGDNNEITNASGNIFFDPGETIDRYASSGICGTFQARLYYSDAVAADANCNFEVNVITTGTGFTDR